MWMVNYMSQLLLNDIDLISMTLDQLRFYSKPYKEHQ